MPIKKRVKEKRVNGKRIKEKRVKDKITKESKREESNRKEGKREEGKREEKRSEKKKRNRERDLIPYLHPSSLHQGKGGCLRFPLSASLCAVSEPLLDSSLTQERVSEKKEVIREEAVAQERR